MLVYVIAISVCVLSNLFFPYDIEIRSIGNIGIPANSVDIASSAAGIETRALLTDERSQGFIDIVVENDNDTSNESLAEFHQAVRTTHLSFAIKPDHNLWELVPKYASDKFFEYWRFDAQLVFTPENVRACLYLASLRLINVKA